VIKKIALTVFSLLLCSYCFAQHSDESGNLKQLNFYQDSLKKLGHALINNENELERKNANYKFLSTLASALKTPNSFLFPFDSVKAITLVNSPDNKFRIFTWHIAFDDGSYRFYGAVQLNTGGSLKLFPLGDYTPMIKNPEDTITDNTKWYGAQYYTIIPVYAAKPYYVLLGWKGNNDKSTKRVIDVISFQNDKVALGMPIFDGNKKKRDRVVFEYTRQTSMHLKYVPEQHLIVFDHLAPPDKKMKDRPETYGADFTYDGYRLKDGRWEYVDNLDMRNVPEERDEQQYVDPKKQAELDRQSLKKGN
jgi:hypothetical protein